MRPISVSTIRIRTRPGRRSQGLMLVGPLPLHLQSRPAVFSAGRLAVSQRARQSDVLLKYLASPEVAPVLRESGLEP